MSAAGRITVYPLRSDYVDALQHPKLAFTDPSLKAGMVRCDKLGIPQPVSGNFASVFQVTTSNGSRWAVKCFCQYVEDQEQRYREISAALRRLRHSSLVEFEYQQHGVLVAGTRYPILKMEWVDAQGLHAWLDENWLDSRRVGALAEQFAELIATLEGVDIAHGDLQHGNLLVAANDRLRLIDYDGMFVPALGGLRATEKGLANYQAPSRADHHFAPGLDRFSAWVIYASLLAISEMPDLWRRLRSNGEEKLLFDAEDFARPGISPALAALRGAGSHTLAVLADIITELSGKEVEEIQPLTPSAVPKSAEAFAPTGILTTHVPGGPSPLPQWMLGELNHLPTPDTDGSNMPVPPGVSWLSEHLPPLNPTTFATSKRGVTAAYITVVTVAALAAGLFAGISLGLSAVLAAPMLFGALVTAPIVLVAGYLRHPEVARRRNVRSALASARIEWRAAQRNLSMQEMEKAAANSAEQNALQEVDKRRKASVHALRQRQRLIDEQLRKRISKLATERAAASANCVREQDAALKAIRDAHIYQRLHRMTIRRNPPHGIGDTLVARLEAAGISTAADFVDYRLVSNQYGSNTQTSALLIRVNGSGVRVDGIGPAKAGSLNSWRFNMVSEAARSAPTALPRAEEKTIRDRFVAVERQIAANEAAARMLAARERASAASEQQQAVNRLDAEARKAASDAASRRLAIASEIDAARKAASRAEYGLLQAQRQAESYRRITLTRYVWFVLTGLS